MDGEIHPGDDGNIDDIRHEIWDPKAFNAALTVDLSCSYEVDLMHDHGLTVNFEVVNLFNELGNATAEVGWPQVIGPSPGTAFRQSYERPGAQSIPLSAPCGNVLRFAPAAVIPRRVHARFSAGPIYEVQCNLDNSRKQTFASTVSGGSAPGHPTRRQDIAHRDHDEEEAIDDQDDYRDVARKCSGCREVTATARKTATAVTLRKPSS
jgi:hypothetical protein